MKKYLYHLREAYSLFRSIVNNDKDGFSVNRVLRWVCRYHCLVVYKDWDIRWKFQKPASRKRFIKLCCTAIKEIEQLYETGLFDSATHYYECHRLLMRLRLFTRKYPMLWWWMFVIRINGIPNRKYHQ